MTHSASTDPRIGLNTIRILVSLSQLSTPTRGPDHDLLRSMDIILEQDQQDRLESHLRSASGRGRLSWMPILEGDSAHLAAGAFQQALTDCMPGGDADMVRASVRRALNAAQRGSRMERIDRGTTTAYIDKVSELLQTALAHTAGPVA